MLGLTENTGPVFLTQAAFAKAHAYSFRRNDPRCSHRQAIRPYKLTTRAGSLTSVTRFQGDEELRDTPQTPKRSDNVGLGRKGAAQKFNLICYKSNAGSWNTSAN